MLRVPSSDDSAQMTQDHCVVVVIVAVGVVVAVAVVVSSAAKLSLSARLQR